MFRQYSLFLLVTLLYIPLNSYAFMEGCAKDIFKVGASLDSGVFSGERDGKNLDLVSEQGLGIYLNWIVYCPDSELEISPYFYFRNYSFEKSEDFGDAEDIELFTVGVEFAKSFSLFGSKFDAILGIGSREDIILGFDNDQIRKRDIDNNLITIGFRKSLFNLFGASGGFKAHVGVLLPGDDDIGTGFTSRVSTDLHYKLAKKYALVLDLFYDYYDQEEKNADVEFSRKELGLGGHFLFRF
jgi:hypothetical protein